MVKKKKPIPKPLVTCFKVDVELYEKSIFISIGQTIEQFVRSLSKHEKSVEADFLKGWDTIKGRWICLDQLDHAIVLKHLPETPYDFSVLAHEIFHSTTMIMHQIGDKLVIDVNDEAYAYLNDYITKRILEGMHRYHNA